MISLLTYIIIGLLSSQTSKNLDTYLSEQLKSISRYEYKIVSLPKIVESFDDQKLKIDYNKKFRINQGYAYVPVDIEVQEGLITNSIVTIRLHLYDKVAVAKRRISKGEELAESDFIIKEKEITHLKNKLVEDFSILRSYRAARNISEDSILKLSMVEKVPSVIIGQKLLAVLNYGSVQISFQVNSRGEGSDGDLIKVVRSDKKIFKAKIINSDKVQIVE